MSMIILNGCSTNEIKTTVIPITESAENTPIATNQPTLIPEPVEEPDQLIFVDENLNPNQSIDIQTILQKYALENNLEFVNNNSLDAEQVKKSLLVFIYPTDENWKNIANESPSTRFIIVSPSEYELPENVYQILTPTSELYFIAGYLSAMVSDDWRVGAVLPDESIDETQISQIFSNGTKYLCGLCSPIYAPVVFFPTVSTITGSIDSNLLNAAYGEIAINRPNTIFLPSKFILDDVLLNIKQNGHVLISSQNNDTVNMDLIDIIIEFDISNALAEILDSNFDLNNHLVKTSFTILDKNAMLTSGKINHINLVFSDLQKGFISPFTIPAE